MVYTEFIEVDDFRTIDLSQIIEDPGVIMQETQTFI